MAHDIGLSPGGKEKAFMGKEKSGRVMSGRREKWPPSQATPLSLLYGSIIGASGGVVTGSKHAKSGCRLGREQDLITTAATQDRYDAGSRRCCC